MFHAPEYYQDVSLRLSEVLNDIGVSEKMVTKRRRTCLLIETMNTISARLLGTQLSHYMLGSQCEGTTTRGLHSDLDHLYCLNDSSVIQDWAEWSPGKHNLLMIQDDTTPPGYCYLQCIKPDVPLPVTEEDGKHFVKDTQGRVLMKNTCIDDDLLPGLQRQGPSLASQGIQGLMDQDRIRAYIFKSLPQSVQHWLDHDHSMWPNAEMKKYAASSDCFVVATGSCVSENYIKDFQWRISTSLAERCFIFNLNISQICCYILLKMILKTFINLHEQKTITSYMCKTVLLHCIRSKPSHVWRDSNILNCLTYCLSTLHQCILCGHCPHFIIPGNNLMAGKISAENKHQLLERMSNLIRHTAGSLLEIQIDDLGQRLQLNIIHGADYNATFSAKNTMISLLNAGYLLLITACSIDVIYIEYLLLFKNQSLETQIHLLIQIVVNLVRFHNEGNLFEQTACRLLSPLYCTTLGSLMASYNIQHNNPVSPQALGWLSAGINLDVSSSRLKFASVFYSTGDMERAAFLLRDTERQYNIQVVQPVCRCYPYPIYNVKLDFSIISLHYNEEMLRYTTAFCVSFLPSEINCVPKELRYEMLRSTGEELLHRWVFNAWMDLAVVDSIPYLYFLQYKTYGYLQRIQDQQRALNNLVFVTVNEKNLGHRETAWNLLGQCMEQENKLGDALQCYTNSLHVRQTNNVARFHICRLLARQIALVRENN